MSVTGIKSGGGDLQTRPEESPLWQAIARHHDEQLYEDKRIVVALRDRSELAEWPWEFVFIIVICWLFYIYAAGRSLGLDALLRRETTLGKSDGILARLYRWAS